jgi:hypothetical protein
LAIIVLMALASFAVIACASTPQLSAMNRQPVRAPASLMRRPAYSSSAAMPGPP